MVCKIIVPHEKGTWAQLISLHLLNLKCINSKKRYFEIEFCSYLIFDSTTKIIKSFVHIFCHTYRFLYFNINSIIKEVLDMHKFKVSTSR